MDSELWQLQIVLPPSERGDRRRLQKTRICTALPPHVGAGGDRASSRCLSTAYLLPLTQYVFQPPLGTRGSALAMDEEERVRSPAFPGWPPGWSVVTCGVRRGAGAPVPTLRASSGSSIPRKEPLCRFFALAFLVIFVFKTSSAGNGLTGLGFPTGEQDAPPTIECNAPDASCLRAFV